MTMLNPIKPTSVATTVVIPACYGEKTINVNFDDLKAKEHVRTGDKYPDLVTQATCTIKFIENAKNRMITDVIKFFDTRGAGAIFLLLKAVWSDLYSRADEMEEGDSISSKELSKIADDVYSSAQMAEYLLNAYLEKRLIEREEKVLENALKGFCE